MPIDNNIRYKGVWYRKIRNWFRGIHEVAFMEFYGFRPDGSAYSGKDLFCECYFNSSRGITPVQCEFKKEVIERIQQEIKETYCEEWACLPLKDAILDIYRKVKSESLSEYWVSKLVYVQEVAKFLGKNEAEIWRACDELFAEEKLDLNGAILCEYVSRFRFPKEIQNLFAYMIEEPLGWPNGDAGDCFLWELEKAIHEHTHFKYGKDAFWQHNYPNLAPHILEMFGFGWLKKAVELAENDPKALDDLVLDFDKVAVQLEDLARRYRFLNAKKLQK